MELLLLCRERQNFEEDTTAKAKPRPSSHGSARSGGRHASCATMGFWAKWLGMHCRQSSVTFTWLLATKKFNTATLQLVAVEDNPRCLLHMLALPVQL